MQHLRVAYTLEQCWGRVPGGTAVAALEVARELAGRADVELIGVAGTHPAAPDPPWDSPIEVARLPGRGALLYAGWVLAGRPRVECATGPVDVAHATSLIPCPAHAPILVTVHDLAFVHLPEAFTVWGRTLFRASLRTIRRRADLVLCSSTATMDDCAHAGIPTERLRLVPLGVRPVDTATLLSKREHVALMYKLPERFVLFVGTIEPRKNLARLIVAMELLDDPMPLVVAGAPGWGPALQPNKRVDVRFLGFVPPDDLTVLYACASVFCYPSMWEGFGLPVLEAMACGAPVVTSAGISTEEAAGGAAVLVQPASSADIARGLHEALQRRDVLVAMGTRRAASMNWSTTAELTVTAYRELAR